MKILIIGSNSIHVSSFVTGLSKKESDLYLLTEDKCSFKEIKAEKIVDFRKLNPFSILKNYFILKKYIVNLRPDVIHIHQLNRLAFFVTLVASKLKVPVVSTAWGSDVLLIPFKNSFFKFLTTKTIQRSNFITADASVMIDAMNKLEKSNSKYILLQYGIEMVEEKEKLNVVYSNRLHKSLYRIDQIILYFKQFVDKNTDWKLVIAGSGDETEILKQIVKDNNLENSVEFVGWLNSNENKDWYSKSKIYISIPESDGTSVSVLEAMSAGCIPVLSDLPVSHEWIRDSINGVIEKENSNPLEKALLIDYEKMKINNKELVLQKASRVNSIEKFFQLYQQLILK
jgi:glycosyltransferase involved in cell wall biosynthesis